MSPDPSLKVNRKWEQNFFTANVYNWSSKWKIHKNTNTHTHTTPRGLAHTCTTTPSTHPMFISGVGSITVCGSVVTESQSFDLFQLLLWRCDVLKAWRELCGYQSVGKAIKRLRVLKRRSPLNQTKLRQSSLDLTGTARLPGPTARDMLEADWGGGTSTDTPLIPQPSWKLPVRKLQSQYFSHDGKKIKNPLSGFRSVEYSYSRNVGSSAWAEGENTPKGIQIIAALKCYSKIQEAILCPFLNPHRQVNELLFSHSGINECNKAGAVLPGERASVILMELDRVTHNPPLLPQLWWKKKKTEEECSHLRQEILYWRKSCG